MSYLKTLGLAAAMAVGLVALLPAPSSATVLCTNSSCTTVYASGTKVSYTLKSGTTSALKGTSGEALDTCTGSTISGKTSSESGTKISSTIESLTWSSCSQTADTVKNGSLSITWTSGSNGSVSSSESQVTVVVFGVSCTYGTGEGTTLGTLTGGEEPVLAVSAVVPKVAGGFLCPSTGKWTAEYVVTEPHALFVGKEKGGGGGATSTSLTTSLSGESKSGEEITVNEGSKVKDTATLSGTNASKATGTVKYKVYADKECKELVTSAGEVTVTSGSVPASEEKTLEAGRVYYWQAEYSGDTNNLSSKSTCGKEVLTVKAATSLATSLSGEAKSGEEITVNEGSKVKDTATLSGTKSSTATGKVKFKVYKDKECKELATEAGEGSLSESKANSEEKELEAGHVYYWQAEYPGDSLHQASTGSCGKEVLTVKATTSLATSLSGEGKEGETITVNEGSKVKDQATLSGTKSSTATGTLKYKVYADKECKELVTNAGEVTVSEGKAPASEEETLSAGAVYYWQASYEGDSLHEKSTSPCTEKATVKATTSIATSFAGEKEPGEGVIVDDETLVSDTATLIGTNASKATGTVKYNVYSDSECEELVTSAGEVSVTAGSVPASEEEALPNGTYYWQAVYSGDSTHVGATSACGNEVELVADGTSLTTSLSSEVESGTEIEVTEETLVADTATLSGASAAEATGSIGYAVYEDSECKELVADAGGEAVIEGVVPPSNEMTLPAGTYYWQASFFGDALNQPSTSACGTEVEIVQPSSLTTSLTGEEQTGGEILVEEGAPVTDTATINEENAETATGTVEYNVYSDSECEELVTSAGKVSITLGSVPPSEAKTLADGTYYWQAVYSGDLTHEGKTSICGTEVEGVAEGTSLTTSLSSEAESGTEIEVSEDILVSDTASLTGAKASEATGSVAYAVYSDPKCQELVAEAGSASVTEGTVSPSNETMLHAGTYYWQAEYFGDEHNQPSISACGTEIETVTVAPLTISLSGGGEEGAAIETEEETPVTATATINEEGAATATGTVKYSVYEDSECKELVASAGEVSVTAGSVPASEAETLSEGTYYWQAVYSGDGTHPGATSICIAAVQDVSEPWVVSLGDSFIAGEGGRWAGNLDKYDLLTPLGPIDPIGNNTYHSALNGEDKNEAIPWCHRAETAEVFIQVGGLGPKANQVHGKNLACSGAKTSSAATETLNGAQKVPTFTPGLDDFNGPQKVPIPSGGLCAIPKCEGQTLLLEKFAGHIQGRIKMIVVSIGGNDFGFGQIVFDCIKAFNRGNECAAKEANRFTPAELAAQKKKIEEGLERVGEALTKPKNVVYKDGYKVGDFTILVQDFPSPLPEAKDINPPDGFARVFARCPIRDKDADWANQTAVNKINETVKEAAANVGKKFQVQFMDLEKAYTGKRLCEKGVHHVHPLVGPIRSWKDKGAVDQTEWVNQVRIMATFGRQILEKPLLKHFFIQEDLHPNYWGYLAQRNCLRQAWNDGKPQSGTCSIDPAGGLAPPAAAAPKPKNWRREPNMVLK